MQRGLVHIYCGEGKGKTTAGVGLAVRAKGRGMKVLFSQFMKPPDGGEVSMLEKLTVRVVRFGDVLSPYFHPGADPDEQRRNALRALEDLKLLMPGYDMVVLDEFLHLVSCGLITEGEALAFLGQKPPAVELVLTGRRAPESLIRAADYVTDMKAVKHPFASGLGAREGIEF